MRDGQQEARIGSALGADLVPTGVQGDPEGVLRRTLREAPGARLAGVVQELGRTDATDADNAVDQLADGLAELSDEVLGELVVACGRLQSWAAGVQARVVAVRAGRESSPLAHDSLVGQVATEMAVTQGEASDVVVRGESGAVHPVVVDALVAGRIDVRKAHTLLRSAAQLTVVERAEAIARYLPHAPRRTWRWLRNKMLAFAKSLHGAAQAARDAALRRSVQLDRSDNDMGWVSAYLPAVDAAAVWGVVDDMAHQLQRTAGEERDLAQLRADSLTGIVTGRLVPADRFGTDDRSGTDDRTSGEAEGTGQAPSSSPTCTCGGTAAAAPVRVTPTRPVVRVTVPATALMGLDDAPADLAGYGPVPAETARRIAQDATWQRLVTDPLTGVLVDYSTTAYQPGRVLRGAVEARDGTCTFPGCDRAASRCDLDHIVPFDHDARGPRQTSAHNLHALCRRHHLLKTHEGWGVVRDPVSGMTTWTTPTGRTWTRPPTVLDSHVDLEQVDPDTSYDLTLRTLRGRAPTGQTPTRRTPPRPAATAPGGPEGPPF